MKKWEEEDSEICLHAGEDNSEYKGAVVPPIYQTSLFTFKNWDSFIEGITSEREHSVYTRGVNPTTKILEEKLAKLERGEKCKCFASGMGAISATMFTFLDKGDHVLFLNNIYGPALSYAKELERFGVENTSAFIKDASDIEEHIKENTKLIYLESPSTMNFDIIDLRAVSKVAKAKGILTVIDNTCLTPIYQKPLTEGIDIVVHSCTKYISGHSDTLGGAVIASYELVDKIFEIGHQFGGAVMSPIDAWLTLRGLRTLTQRLEYQSKSVEEVVEFLKEQDEIKKINHPLLFEGEKKEINDRQTSGYTSLLSAEIKFTNYDQLRDFMNAFEVFQLGVSWGGFESLIVSPNYGTEEKHEDLEITQIANDLVRIYVGLENTKVLIKDLKRAFATLNN